MVSTIKKNNKIKTKNISSSEKMAKDKISKRKMSLRKFSRSSTINNKKVLREKKSSIDYNRNWSWAHSIMHITVSLLFSIILYNTFISEFFAYSITTREKRDIINKRLKYIRTKRAPIDNSYHCDEDNCKLPKCKCFSENNPGSLKTKDIPQFVLISIDGSLTNKSIKYQNQITENVMSPNGCPAMITNFATDENSDFFEIESAYVKNNEIAFNLNETESKIITPKMVNSLRDLVEKFTNIDKKEIIGFRYTGNERLKVNIYHDICDLEYLYDSSFSISPLNNFWPFTLDYGIPTEFNSKSLISGVYPELWEIPIYELLNPDNSTFAIWEPNVSSNGKLLEILKNNFLNLHYNNNRIPFTMPLTKQWLEQDKRIETINEFLKWIVDETNNDTYFINYSQLIEWMKNPVKLDNINKSGIFKCENNRKISCKNPNLCLYKSASFKTCKECPIQNPYLEANLDDIPELSSECNKKVPEDGCGNGVWECGCQCLNNDNNLDGYCLDEFGKCTIPKVYKENVGYICENQ